MQNRTTLDYQILDVFGSRFAGNQLAVVFDSDELSTEQMGTIAREFNFSETIFIGSELDPGTYPVRIFTPARELPFAGHPTVGAAVALSIETGVEHLLLREKIGDVHAVAWPGDNGEGRARFEVPRPAERGPAPEQTAEQLVSLFGLSTSDLHPDREPTTWEGGLRFTLIPLGTEAAVRQAELELSEWRRVMEASWAPALYLFAPVGAEDALVVRMFAPGAGVLEDPATGSAAAVLARYLFEESGSKASHSWTLSQGRELGRPSTIEISARPGDGPPRIWVEGDAAITARGQIAVPDLSTADE